MNASQRIVFNTAATYIRSVFAIALALFSSRWIFTALGEIDYGIFSIVGSLIIFIAFLNSVMGASAARFYAFAIGQGEITEVNNWFNAALSIHVCFAIVLTLFGWPIGEYVILHVLSIPPDRVQASLSVFRISLMATFANMISIPYIAMFTAKQHIAELAVWGLLQTSLVFILAFVLMFVPGDRLIFYAVGMTSILIIIQIAQIIRASSVFCECSIKLGRWFDKKHLKEIFTFAGWNLVGTLGATLRDQGSAILLNLFFGPKVNAAYGIANQVSVQTNQLAAAMMGAFTPEITSSEGRGDRGRMLDLSLRASKFSTMLVIIFAVPLIVEIHYVLKLWLVDPPMYTALFCKLILCTFIIDRLSNGYMLAVNAYGKIAAYQITLGTILVFTLPLAWLFLKLGFAPTSVGFAFIITMALCSGGRVLWVKCLLDFPIRNWIVAVLIPCLGVSTFAILGAIIPSCFLQPSLYRLCLSILLSIFSLSLSAWFIAIDSREKLFIVDNAWRLLRNARNKFIQYRQNT